jgi:hypothetical protein
MNASVLVAFAGVFLIAAIGAVFVWILGSAAEQGRGDQSLERTLERKAWDDFFTD